MALKFKTSFAALIAITVVGCGSGSGGNSGSTGIDGNWTSECTNMGAPGVGAATFSFQTTFFLQGGNLESKTMSYAAAGCAGTAKAATLARNGTYTVGEASTGTPGATNLDLP